MGVKHRLISRANRGTWELTEDGKRRAQAAADKVAKR
jgi:hypothetical protein